MPITTTVLNEKLSLESNRHNRRYSKTSAYKNLNKRSKIVSACRHKRHYYFGNKKSAAASIVPRWSTHTPHWQQKPAAFGILSLSPDDSSRMKQTEVENWGNYTFLIVSNAIAWGKLAIKLPGVIALGLLQTFLTQKTISRQAMVLVWNIMIAEK